MNPILENENIINSYPYAFIKKRSSSSDNKRTIQNLSYHATRNLKKSNSQEKDKEKKINFLVSKNYQNFKQEITKKLPWVTDKTVKSDINMKFHFEIFDFYSYIKPDETENNLRIKTFYMFKNIINIRWPTWVVRLFGSFPIDLHLKDSDLDITIKKSNNLNFSTENLTDYDQISELDQLTLIYNEIINKNFADKNETNIIYAKVPIIKCLCKDTRIKIDICINQGRGIKTAYIMSEIIHHYPFIKPIVLILKYILRQRNLNETFKGGISSFVIFNLVYAYILFLMRVNKLYLISFDNKNVGLKEEFHTLKNNKYFNLEQMPSIDNLGTLFYGFLNFYGFEFDYKRYGISNNNTGNFFLKSQHRNFSYNEKICIENILDRNQDIGRASFNYDQIVDLFKTLVIKIHDFNNILMGNNLVGKLNREKVNVNNNKDDYENISYIDKIIFYANIEN